jgi:hypothetical protein
MDGCINEIDNALTKSKQKPVYLLNGNNGNNGKVGSFEIATSGASTPTFRTCHYFSPESRLRNAREELLLRQPVVARKKTFVTLGLSTWKTLNFAQ